MHRLLKTLPLLILTGLQLYAAELPMAKPESQGLDADTLKEMDAFFSKYVEDKRMSGFTTLVARKGEIIHFNAGGHRVVEEKEPMKTDSIFRIFSMTKPVTGVGLMILWEEGKFKLDDPVSKYLPEFSDVRVYTGTNDTGAVETEPAKREITVMDLMRHTAGMGYGFNADHPVEKMYQEADLWNTEDLDDLVSTVAKLPLIDHPGNQWIYSVSVDVQGKLIEVLSGQTLDVFFEERIFKPLGMNDTGFAVPEGKLHRMATLYGHDEKGKLKTMGDDFRNWEVTELPHILSGGGGLMSSTADYWRFAQMVANGGELDGVRILKPKTIALMTKDQIPAEIADHTRAFGIDFGIVEDMKSESEYGNNGELNWGGAASTLFWIDPEDEIVAVMMTQLMPYNALPLRNDMRKYVYSALEE